MRPVNDALRVYWNLMAWLAIVGTIVAVVMALFSPWAVGVPVL